jgi:hypothetical protein
VAAQAADAVARVEVGGTPEPSVAPGGGPATAGEQA